MKISNYNDNITSAYFNEDVSDCDCDDFHDYIVVQSSAYQCSLDQKCSKKFKRQLFPTNCSKELTNFQLVYG